MGTLGLAVFFALMVFFISPKTIGESWALVECSYRGDCPATDDAPVAPRDES